MHLGFCLEFIDHGVKVVNFHVHVLMNCIGSLLLVFVEEDLLPEGVNLFIGLLEFEFPFLHIGFVKDVVSFCLMGGFN